MARPTAKNNALLSVKHQLVDKANTYLVVASAMATVIVVFSIFASVELFHKISYQNKVIGYRQDGLKVLKENQNNVEKLKAQYIAFDDVPEPIIPSEDKNSKIILDALPSKYDFPAFITSITQLVKQSGLTIESIDGEDSELDAKASELQPKPVEIPFKIEAKGDYVGVQKLVDYLQRSIRPFKVTEFNIQSQESNDATSLTVSITGVSYYQPSKEIGIDEEVVKSDKRFGQSTNSKDSNSSTPNDAKNTGGSN